MRGGRWQVGLGGGGLRHWDTWPAGQQNAEGAGRAGHWIADRRLWFHEPREQLSANPGHKIRTGRLGWAPGALPSPVSQGQRTPRTRWRRHWRRGRPGLLGRYGLVWVAGEVGDDLIRIMVRSGLHERGWGGQTAEGEPSIDRGILRRAITRD
jgi:hypothetical protein